MRLLTLIIVIICAVSLQAQTYGDPISELKAVAGSSDSRLLSFDANGLPNLIDSDVYYSRIGAFSSLETGAGGPILRPSSDASNVTGTWARSFMIQNVGATKALELGLISDGNNPRYGYIGIQNAGANFSGLNALRLYPSYVAYGTFKLYHEGYKPTLTEITATGNTSVSNLLLGGLSTSQIGLEIGKASNLPTGQIMGAIISASSLSGHTNGDVIIIPRQSISTNTINLYTGQNGLGFRLNGDGTLVAPHYAGAGNRYGGYDDSGKFIVMSDPVWDHTGAQNIDLGTHYLSPSGANEGLRFTSGTLEVNVSNPFAQRWTNGTNSSVFYLDPTAGFQLKSSGRGLNATSTSAALESGSGAVEIDDASHMLISPASTNANVVGEIARRGDFFQVRRTAGLDTLAYSSDLIPAEESTNIPSASKVFDLEVDQLTVDLTGVTGTKTVSLPTPLSAWIGFEKTIVRVDNNSGAVLNVVTGTGADINNQAVIMLSTNNYYTCRTDGAEVICK